MPKYRYKVEIVAKRFEYSGDTFVKEKVFCRLSADVHEKSWAIHFYKKFYEVLWDFQDRYWNLGKYKDGVIIRRRYGRKRGTGARTTAS